MASILKHKADEDPTWRGKVRGMTPDEVEEFLGLGVNMYLACLTTDGDPYVTVCWHEWRDGYFWIVPRQHSRWAEYLASDPRVSFVVEQPKNLGKVLGILDQFEGRNQPKRTG